MHMAHHVIPTLDSYCRLNIFNVGPNMVVSVTLVEQNWSTKMFQYTFE